MRTLIWKINKITNAAQCSNLGTGRFLPGTVKDKVMPASFCEASIFEVHAKSLSDCKTDAVKINLKNITVNKGGDKVCERSTLQNHVRGKKKKSNTSSLERDASIDITRQPHACFHDLTRLRRACAI